MNLSFLHPYLFFLLPLAAIPLLLHLFAKSRPPVFRFPSINFIRRAQRNTLRIKKPKDHLLLLLRTLLMLALLGLFLRPVMHLPGAGPSAGNRTICLLLDATASMGASESGQTRFANACAEASEALRDLSPDDKVNLIWMRVQPEPVFPQPGINLTMLQSELRKAIPTFEAGDPLAALTLAATMLQEESAEEKAIYIISDFQRTVWETIQWTPPDGIELVMIPVAQDTVANTSITDLSCIPTTPLPHDVVTITAIIANYGSQPIQQTVYLSVGAQRMSRSISLPASNRVSVAFTINTPQETTLADCSIADDLFPADNHRLMTIQPDNKLRVALYDTDTAVGRIWGRVVRALNWTEGVPVQSLEEIESCDVVLLSGWNGIKEKNKINALLNEGIPIIWYPAQSLSTEALQPWFTLKEPGPINITESSQKLTLQIAEPNHNLFSLFRNGAYGDPTRAQFSSHMTFPPFADDVSMLLRYSDQSPALLKHQTLPLYLWNIPLDKAVTSWSMHEEFFTLFAELLRLEHRSSARAQPLHYPGYSLSLALETAIDQHDLSLKNEEGQPMQLLEATDPNETALSTPISIPGAYTWYFKDTALKTQCVNFPEIESDLTPTTPDGILKDSGVVVGSGIQVRRLREGIEIWPYFLCMALGFILLELLVAWHAEKTGS